MIEWEDAFAVRERAKCVQCYFSLLNIYSISKPNIVSMPYMHNNRHIALRQQIHILCVIYFEQLLLDVTLFAIAVFAIFATFAIFCCYSIANSIAFVVFVTLDVSFTFGNGSNQFRPNRWIWTIFNMICYWKRNLFK